MAKTPDMPDPMWADQFKAEKPGEASEEVEEEAKPLPPEQSPTET